MELEVKCNNGVWRVTGLYPKLVIASKLYRNGASMLVINRQALPIVYDLLAVLYKIRRVREINVSYGVYRGIEATMISYETKSKQVAKATLGMFTLCGKTKDWNLRRLEQFCLNQKNTELMKQKFGWNLEQSLITRTGALVSYPNSIELVK